jgi:hypothetical protein
MRLTIFLDDEEARALKAMARQDVRQLKEQLRFLLRKEIEQRGLDKPGCKTHPHQKTEWQND